METAPTEADVIRIITEDLGIPEEMTQPDTCLGDVHFDEIDILQLAMIAERRFGIRIPREAEEGLVTIKDAIGMVLTQVV